MHWQCFSFQGYAIQSFQYYQSEDHFLLEHFDDSAPPTPGSLASSQSPMVLCPLSPQRALVSSQFCSWSASIIILPFLVIAPNIYMSSPNFSTEFHTYKPTFPSMHFTGISAPNQNRHPSFSLNNSVSPLHPHPLAQQVLRLIPS